MLLSADKLSYRVVDERIEPFWLSENDEEWVGHARQAMLTAAGQPLCAADAVIGAKVVPLARAAGAPPRVAFALWAIERQGWELRVDAPVEPAALREVLFDLAAKHAHDEALDLAAARFAVHPEDITGALFADRMERRILVAPEATVSAADAIVRYNLAVVQAMVARSMALEGFVRDDVERIVQFSKRLGLIATFEREGDAVRLALSGPLALFHDTTKYGRALARFVPALASAPAWSLKAHVVLGERTGWLELDETGPLARLHALPADGDARITRLVARSLRRGGFDWRVDRAELVHVGRAIVAPDFVLVRDGARVLVDVVPFATPDHLARKLDIARALDVPMLLCVDTRFAPPEPMMNVVRHSGVIDVGELVLAAERISVDAYREPPPCRASRAAS